MADGGGVNVSSSIDRRANEQLGEHHLRVIDAIAQSVGFMGPVFSSALLIPLVVGAGASSKGAGIATPLAIILAGIGIGAIGWIIAAYSKRIHAAGALYDYVTDGLGKRIGFVAGWLYYGCTMILASAIVVVVGGITSDFLRSTYGVGIPYWLLDLIYAILLFSFLYFGVRISTRVQLTLVFSSVLFVVGFLISVIIRGGHGGNTIRPFNPTASADGWSGIFFGIIYAILLFVGFESAANLGEETAHPKKSVPLAIIGSVVVVGVIFVVGAYAQDIGFGLNVAKWAANPAPLFTLGASGNFGNSIIFDLLNIVVILDIMAVGLGAAVATTRGLFAMARDRRIPSTFAKVNRRWGTPVNAIIFQVLVGVAFVVLVRLDKGVFPLHGSPQYFPLFAWMAGLGGLGLVVVYATIAIGAIPGLWNYARRFSLVVAVLVGFVVSAGGIFGSIYKVSAPDNQWIWYLIGWVACGSALTIWNLAHENHSLTVRSETNVEFAVPEMVEQLREGDIG
ncbi:MAG: APC family permease [Actinobacteria bacterium]|jgi:amino acid transporter|nr:APC family permease [Actinomycetota bacterium]MCL6094804.1 APC family permease [Actinomycetota bacterium]